MLDNIKHLLLFKSVDKDIADNNFESALEKLNYLIKEEFKPSETFLKRGQLCHKLLMLEDAYSDFTYIITHCVKKEAAYKERIFLNFETGCFMESISDAAMLLEKTPCDFEIQKIVFLSLVFLNKMDEAKDYILGIFNNNKYKTLQFLFQEVAVLLADDELAKGLKLLDSIDTIDPDNPIKLLKEANIYEIAGDDNKKTEILKRIDSIFPKYFISHFRFTDIYQNKDIL